MDISTFQRVQVRLGDKIYESHDLLFGSELIRCGHCGKPVTGECKSKKTKTGDRQYTYYRCSKYSVDGHPRFRVPEGELNEQVLGLFNRMRIQDDGLRTWFAEVLRVRREVRHQDVKARRSDLDRQLTSLRQQQERLLNLRLMDEIDQTTFAAKSTEQRDGIQTLEAVLASIHDQEPDNGGIAEKAFELSQTLKEKWLAANVQRKRQLLGIVCLNFSLDGATLVPTIRKPFDILAEGPSVLLSRGDRI